MRFITNSMALILSLALAGTATAQDYWSGGAGIESREQAPDDMNTAFEFFDAEGQYVMNIDVRITNVSTGEVLFSRNVRGPWFMIGLPDGQYRIEAARPSTQEVERVVFRVEGQDLPMMGLKYTDPE